MPFWSMAGTIWSDPVNLQGLNLFMVNFTFLLPKSSLDLLQALLLLLFLVSLYEIWESIGSSEKKKMQILKT
jgi:hypothetical protein